MAAAARAGLWGMGRGFTWLSSATWVVPTRWGYPAFLNFISMPTSVLPTTSLAAGCLAFSANRLPRLVGLRGVTNADPKLTSEPHPQNARHPT